MKHPLIPVTLLLVAGIVLGERIHCPPSSLLAFSFAATLGALILCLLNLRRAFLAAAGFAWLLAGWSDMAGRTAIISPHDLRLLLKEEPTEMQVHGVVIGTPVGKTFTERGVTTSIATLKIAVDQINPGSGWAAAFGNVVARVSGELPRNPSAGQEMVLSGVMEPPAGPRAQGLFNARKYYARQGIYFEIKAEAGALTWVSNPEAGAPLSQRFSNWARKALRLGLPAEDEPLRLIWTLVLGGREEFTPEIEAPFLRAGTFHIFAVDGLRIGLLAGIGIGLLRVLQVRRALAGLIIFPAIWWYISLTGWPASAVRAGIMTSVVIAGWAIKRPWNLLNSLFAAALIILVWDPQQLFQAGFQLSFAVVFCIALLVRPLHRALDKKNAARSLTPQAAVPVWKQRLAPARRFAVDTFAMSLGAWLGSIPVGAYYFHLFTPMSVPANFIVVPLTILTLTGSIASLLVAPICPYLSELFNSSSWLWMKCILGISEWFSRWPGAYWNAASPRPIGFTWYYLVLLTVCTGWAFQSRRKWFVLGAIAILSVAWVVDWRIERGLARIDVLTLRQEPAVFVRPSRESREMLLDCGDSDSAQRTVTPFLEAQGVNYLDCFCLTAARAPAMGGVEVIWTNFPPRKLFVGATRSRSGIYKRFLGVATAGKRPGSVLKDGDQVDGWSVLAPASTAALNRADDNAVVLQKSINGQSVLLLSSLGRNGQDALALRHPELRTDVLVAGLPAADEPVSEPLLDLVQPKTLIIGDSKQTADARGTPRLVQRLGRRPLRVIYCHQVGSVTLIVRKGGVNIEDADERKL